MPRGEGRYFHLAIQIHKEFGHLINITKAAEFLEFVDTPKQKILLTELGKICGIRHHREEGTLERAVI